MNVSKKALKSELTAILEKTLEGLEAAHADTREAATHPEAKPENDKDTRALEQSYLARGQAMRIEALKAGLSAVGAMSLAATTTAKAGALIEVEDEDAQTVRYYLAPEGGGTKLAKNSVQVVTPVSPLGAALMGKREGDEVELTLAGKKRVLSVVGIT
ncbi:MAG: GreA/GreB family elongation factor [Archangium sp.]|nr:GreA/GreB family elongation factor [Archangium sp.]